MLSSLGGCSTYRDPSIAVSGASMGAVSDEAMVLNITLDMGNPNHESLELLDLDYDVSINGVAVYPGLRSAQATLAADNRRQLTIPAVVRFDRLGWTRGAVPPQVRYSITGNLQYVTPGEIAQTLLDIGVRRPHVGFAGQGEVELAAPAGAGKNRTED